MASGLILVGKEFFIFWAGNDYEKSYYVALLLIIPACIPLIQNLGVSIRQALNKHKFSAIIRLSVAIINLIISIPLSIRFGAIGAALGTCIGLSISSFIHNIYYQKIIKLDMIDYWKNIVKISLPFSIPWTITLIIKNLTNLSGLVSIIVISGIFTILYIPTAYFLCMNEYEKNIVQNIFNKLLLRKG